MAEITDKSIAEFLADECEEHLAGWHGQDKWLEDFETRVETDWPTVETPHFIVSIHNDDGSTQRFKVSVVPDGDFQ